MNAYLPNTYATNGVPSIKRRSSRLILRLLAALLLEFVRQAFGEVMK